MNERQETLIILTPGFPANEDDSTCLPPKQVFIKSLNKAFPLLKVIVISFQYPYSTKEYSWFSNTVIPFNGKNYSGKLKRFFLWLYVWKKLNALKKQNKIIGLYSFWLGEVAVIGKRFAKANHLPHFCWLSGQDAKPGNVYVKLMKPKPSELIAMSDFLQNEFQKNYSIKPTHVIPLGIDDNMFQNISPPKNIDILGAGSLIPLKQYDLFIEVIKQIVQHYKSLTVVLCGKGKEEDKLRQLISNYSLQQNIFLTGELPHSTVLNYMQRSKIFLHTSAYEGFGFVCLEALYAGAHVISFTKPMNIAVPHWYNVNTKEEMMAKVFQLLQQTNLSYQAIAPFKMENTAKAVVHLFTGK